MTIYEFYDLFWGGADCRNPEAHHGILTLTLWSEDAAEVAVGLGFISDAHREHGPDRRSMLGVWQRPTPSTFPAGRRASQS